MDDSAFFYSRTRRIIAILAIVAPLTIVGGLVWYYASESAPENPATPPEAPALEETQVVAPPAQMTPDDENPLRPVGPKASTRMTPGGSVCQYCGGAGCPSCR